MATSQWDPRRISSPSILIAIAGALALGAIAATVVAVASTDGRLADAAQWTLFMLAAGWLAALLGLVFAIPRVRSGFAPGASERYESNSNLEQISDWFTKLLVGAGLVQLSAAPAAMRTLGDYLGTGLNVPNPSAYAASAVIYGLGVGFGGGYVWTRLRFRALLEQGDKEAAEASRQIDRVTDRLAVANAGAEVKEAPARIRQAAVQAVAQTRKSDPAGRLPILWVDDHPENNTAIVAALEDLEIRVETVRSTADALRRVAHDDYALIISDLGRTEDGANHPMAGLELLEALKAQGVATPVIVFAGARGIAEAARLREAGARLVTQRASEVFTEAVRYVTGK